MRDIGCARCTQPVRDGIYFLCIWNSIQYYVPAIEPTFNGTPQILAFRVTPVQSAHPLGVRLTPTIIIPK